MEKQNQTEEVKVRLYNLTTMFTKKYVHRYYKQFEGDVNDLASEYYLQFLTPKSRVKGMEQTLLDKFDGNITSLEYLVKVSVQRKLIDSSRQNPRNAVSIDRVVDEFGDMMIQNFNLVTSDEETVDTIEFPIEFKLAAKTKLDKLSKRMQEKVKTQFEEIKDVIAPAYRELFEEIFDEDETIAEEVVKSIKLIVDTGIEKLTAFCSQLTEKTICIQTPTNYYKFDRFTGEPRSKQYSDLRITAETLEEIKSISKFKGQLVEDFLTY